MGSRAEKRKYSANAPYTARAAALPKAPCSRAKKVLSVREDSQKTAASTSPWAKKLPKAARSRSLPAS